MEFAADFSYISAVRVFVAEVNRSQVTFGPLVQLHLVQRRHGVACAHLARVHRVVEEVFIGYSPIFVTQQPVAADYFGIEVHLDFGFCGDYL